MKTADWRTAYVNPNRFWMLRVWRQRIQDAWLVLTGRESIGGW